jgi:hypothetical protein
VRSTDPGWRYLLEYEAVEVVECVWYAKQEDGASVEELPQWAIDHHRGEDWLDQPLRSTTRPDRPSPAEIPTQVGLPEPTSRRMLLRLFRCPRRLDLRRGSYVRAKEPPSARSPPRTKYTRPSGMPYAEGRSGRRPVDG